MADTDFKAVDITYCSECQAILSPKRKICDACGKYRRVFHASVNIHAGSTFIPLCKQCMDEVYKPWIDEMSNIGNQKGMEGGEDR